MAVNFNNISLSSTILTQNVFPLRNILERVPTEYQTTELTKFFNTNVNYWFTPGDAQTYNGYIGEITEWYNPNTDNYIIEPNANRSFYQLEPAITLKDENSNITEVINYTDIINSLEEEGCNVDNQDRLFSSEYYAWCPPIDIDKFVNYSNYYWVSDIDNFFLLKGTQEKYYVKTSILNDVSGYTSLDISSPVITVSSKEIMIEYNGDIIPPSLYSINSSNEIVFSFSLKINDKIIVIYQTDITSDFIGKATVSASNYGLENLNNGMRIKCLYDKTASYNENCYIINGIGNDITLTKDVENYDSIIGNSVQYTGGSTTYKISEDFFVSGMTKDNIKIYIDGYILPESFYSYDGSLTITLTPVLTSSNTVVIYTPSNIETYFKEYVTQIYGLYVKRNQIINITNDINSEYNGIFVITFTNDVFGITSYEEFYDADYITIEKDSFSIWSQKNRWFHKDNISTTLVVSDKATRPIIEFYKDITLFEYGNSRRGDVDFITLGKTNLDNLITSSNVFGIIDGIRVDMSYVTTNGGYITILVTNDVNTDYNNKFMQLYINTNGKYALSVVNNGYYQNGSPYTGEITKVLSGKNAGIEYYYNGTSWTKAQAKNQFPLFTLFDENGIELDNSTTYPSSSFAGNTIFQYATGSGTNDSVLGFPLDYNSDGNILFNNTLYSEQYTYLNNSVTTDINSENYYYSIAGSLGNSWHKSNNKTQQTVTNTYTFDGVENSVIMPYGNVTIVSAMLYDSSLTDYPYVNSLDSSSYTISDNILTLSSVPASGSKLILETYSSDTPEFGDYNIPDCLAINPDNNIADEISYNETLTQFNKIINGSWLTNSVPDYSLGNDIIIQDSDILTLGLLLKENDLNPISVINFVRNEYIKYKNNFQNLVYDYSNNNLFTGSTIAAKCQQIVSIMAQEKSKNSPFYNTGIGKTSTYTQETYIPTTPTCEYMYRLYIPAIIEDRSLAVKSNGCYQTFIRCHDGSRVLTYGDYTVDISGTVTSVTYNQNDYIYLELEQRIYNSLTAQTIKYSIFDEKPGYFRTTTSYSLEEYNNLMKPFFDEWCAKNNINGYQNTNTDKSDVFSWNYAYSLDKDNNYLQGSYRAIYDYYYDTINPHLYPWEMLGFSSQPSWWTTEYGSAPYTSNNFKLWNDLSKGYVRSLTPYIDANFIREGLLDVIPVDEYGNLLNPAAIGLIKNLVSLPSGNIAMGNNAVAGWNNDWKFGNIGPVEYLWRTSSEFPFAVVATLYKQKPANFIDNLFDTSETNSLFTTRLKHSEIYVDGETVDNALIAKTGFNEWISSYLKSKGKNVTTALGDKVRSLGVNLTHRMAGFTKSDDLTLYSDVYGDIPQENITNILHYGEIVNPVYSAVTVVFTGTKYNVYGFDKTNQYFRYYEVSETGKYNSIATVNTASPKYRSWTKNTYYALDNVIEYKGNWYICNQAHTSSTIFEDTFWTKTDKPVINDDIYAKWYSTNTGIIKRVNYGEGFGTIQEVVNFLNGLQLYNAGNGFDFSNASFEDSAKEFLSWTNIVRLENAFITLSPFEEGVYYSLTNGIVANTKAPYFYMYDISGNNITDFDTTRSQTEFTTTSDTGIFYCKLTVNQYEHVVVIDNTTIYDDKIYDPTINVREKRLLINGFVTTNWNGTMNAPGFIVTGDTIVPNFEKTVDNFRRYFDIETVDQNDIQNYARKNIGYEKKDYLTDLKLSDTNQFEFYQGMITQKGTVSSFNKLTRSNVISGSENIQFAEEWAIRNSLYGNTEDKKVIQLSISNSDINFDPQMVKFNSFYVDDSFTFSKTYKNDTLPNISNDSSDAELMTTSNVIPGLTVANVITDSFGFNVNVTELTIEIQTIDEDGTITVTIGDTVIFKDLSLSTISTTNYTISVSSASSITIEMDNVTTGVILITTTGSKIVDYTNTSTNYLEINDYYSSVTNKLIQRDNKWQWRYDVRTTGPEWTDTFSKPLLPTAGYVNVDWMDYYCNTTDDLIDTFSDAMESYPSTETAYTYTFSYDGISSTPTNVKTKIIPSIKSKGYGRINTVNVNLTNPLPNNGLVINVIRNSETLLSIKSNDLYVGDNTYYVFDFMSLNNTDNSVYLSFEYQDLAAIGYDIANCVVTVEYEVFDENGILPNQNAWVYNDGGTWNTYKLQDTMLGIKETFPSSYTGQGTVVSLDNEFTDINTGDYVIISGSLATSTGTTEDVFGYNTLTTKTSNTRTYNITTNATASYDLMEFVYEAGMVVDSIIVNNSVAIDQTNYPTIITIGNATNKESILEGYVPPVTFTPSNVMLYCDCLCTNTSTTAPTEGTSVTTSTNCFDTNGTVKVDISNTTITLGDDLSYIPIQVTRTGDIFNTITSVTMTNTGSGYTTATATVVGASGYTATPVITDGKITSITITNSGGCSLPLDTTPTITISGDGTGAAATANVTNVADVPTVVGWRYRDVTNNGGYIVGGTITFPVIDDSTGNDFWSQIIEFTYPTLTSSSNVYEIEIYDVNDIGYTITNDSTEITIYNTVVNSDSVNLGVTGRTTLSNIGQVENTEEIYIYMTNKTTSTDSDSNQNTVSCNLTVTVNYHYIQGFEVYQAGQAFTTDENSLGGSLLKWKKTHFINETFTNPDGGWQENDIIHIDYVPATKNWQVQKYINSVWTTEEQYQNRYIDNSILSNVTLYSANKKITERFNVYNPLQNMLPGNFDKNIDFKSKIDPAKYNSTNTNEKHVWSFNKVGQIWWDLSSTFYIDYTLYDINYTRDNWGKVVPDCDVRVYEWIRSPVAPNLWSTYVSSKTYTYNGFDTNPSGSVDSDNINYTMVSEWNENINAYQTVYYFWVYNKTTLPNVVMTRNMTASQITNYIKDINQFKEPYAALTKENSLIIGNIEKSIKSDDSVLKIVLNEGEIDQRHSEWNIIRETDTINSVPTNIWDKFINSVCGFKEITKTLEHSSYLTADARTTSTSITLENTNNLQPCGEIRIGNTWYAYSSIIGNTLYGVNVTKLITKNTATYSKVTLDEYINVPDSSLTDFEMFGINEQPLQSMIPVYENSQGLYVPNRNVIKTLITAINTVLLSTNFIDNVSNWNLVFGSTQAEPSFYTYKISSLSEISNYTLTLNDVILVEANSTNNNMWILYKYDPTNGNSDSNGLYIIDAQLWSVSKGYIWNYADWYATGYSSSNTPKYTFDTMDDKNNFTFGDDVLLSGTLVQINQISKDDDRWTWQLHKDGLWTTVAIENGTLELTDIFYENDFVLNVSDYSVTNILLRDGNFELNYLLNNLSEIFTTEELNSIFFQTMRSILNETSYPVDWLFKTSFMYIDGYQEKLNMTEIESVNNFDYIIEYLEEVKPYHVKIRDYLIQYVPEQENLNAKVTDFDFPTDNGTVLYPYTEAGTYGNTHYNGADTTTVSSNSPWKEWYNNYTNPYNMDVNTWSSDWNGVRQFKIIITIDNVGLVNTAEWDVGNWDYSQTVIGGNNEMVSDIETLQTKYNIDTNKLITVNYYYDLKQLLTSGTYDYTSVVYVQLENKFYFFDGTEWVQFFGKLWDTSSLTSAYDRIENLYNPTELQNKDAKSLVNAYYKGTVWYAGDFANGNWNNYAWDWYSGFANEDAYYTGFDDQLSTTNVTDNFSGYVPTLTYDYESRDLDVEAPTLSDPTFPGDTIYSPNTGYYSYDILAWGSFFRDPEIDENSTSEKVELKVTSSVIMRIIDEDSKIVFYKDYSDKWHVQNLTNVIESNISSTMKYNTGYSAIQNASVTNPLTVYLDYDIDKQNVVEVKEEVVYYNGTDDIEYGNQYFTIPVLTIDGKLTKSDSLPVSFSSNTGDGAIIANNYSYYWIDDEIVSCESIRTLNGNSVMYKLNRYLLGSHIPVVSKNNLNIIDDTTIVYENSTIIPCNFETTFEPQENVGFYFPTKNGFGLFGITLVGED